jgi:hypothetical protein
MRVKKATLNNVLADYCRVIGKQCGYELGNYHLDKRPACYGGGYRIAEQLDKGSITYPFGYSCHTGQQMLDMLHFALMSIKLYQDPNKESAWAWPKEMATKR